MRRAAERLDNRNKMERCATSLTWQLDARSRGGAVGELRREGDAACSCNSTNRLRPHSMPYENIDDILAIVSRAKYTRERLARSRHLRVFRVSSSNATAFREVGKQAVEQRARSGIIRTRQGREGR